MAQKYLDEAGLEQVWGKVKDFAGKTTTPKTTEAITVAGGPLADDTADNWPDTWKDSTGNRQIPANLSVQEILTGLFLKTIDGTLGNPTYTWNPTLAAPSVSLNKTGTQEVGTKATATFTPTTTVNSNTATATVTASQGYFEGDSTTHKAGNYTQNVTGTSDASNAAVTGTWNGTAITSGAEVVITEGTNTLSVSETGVTASHTAFTDTVLYASTNTKQKLAGVSKTVSKAAETKDLTSSASKSVTGAWASWYGFINSNINADNLTSEYFRGISGSISSSSNVMGKTLNTLKDDDIIKSQAGFKGIIIAIPSNQSIKQLLNTTSGDDLMKAMLSKTITIEGADSHPGRQYTVYYQNWAAGGDQGDWKVIMNK